MVSPALKFRFAVLSAHPVHLVDETRQRFVGTQDYLWLSCAADHVQSA